MTAVTERHLVGVRKVTFAYSLLALCLLLCAPALQALEWPTTPGVHVLGPLPIPGLQRKRLIRIYLPPSYGCVENGRSGLVPRCRARDKRAPAATSGGRGHGRDYPVMYMHDAQNLFDAKTAFAGEWGVDETLDELARSHGIELIVIGIDHGDELRIRELSPWTNPRFGDAEGAAYLDFIVDTLKPLVDQHLRTRPDREHTAIAGSSIGALSAHYALFEHRTVFSKAALLSPSYWYSEEIFEFTKKRRLAPDARVYLAVGEDEGDEPGKTIADVQRMSKLLRSRAPRTTQIRSLVRQGAQHNEAFWRAEFRRAVLYLFAG